MFRRISPVLGSLILVWFAVSVLPATAESHLVWGRAVGDLYQIEAQGIDLRTQGIRLLRLDDCLHQPFAPNASVDDWFVAAHSINAEILWMLDMTYPGHSNNGLVIGTSQDADIQHGVDVARAHPEIAYFELGNEFYMSEWNVSEYVAFAYRMRDAIKAVRPGAKIGIIDNALFDDENWTPAIRAVSRDFDWVAIHSYPDSIFPHWVSGQAAQKAALHGRPIGVTEWDITYWNPSAQALFDTPQYADWVRQQLTEMAAQGTLIANYHHAIHRNWANGCGASGGGLAKRGPDSLENLVFRQTAPPAPPAPTPEPNT